MRCKAAGLAVAGGAGENTVMNRNTKSGKRQDAVILGRFAMGTLGTSMLSLLLLAAAGCAGGSRQSEQARLEAGGPAKIVITRPGEYRTVSQDWGSLTWFVSAEQGNCGTMTVGQATLKPGQASARHMHPNCDEVLHVIKGTIVHSLGDGKEARMSAGDTVTIPVGIAHYARNVGDEEAVMILSYSSAYRKVVNE
jgi:quercetin dioxygenase-like cupin family protein